MFEGKVSNRYDITICEACFSKKSNAYKVKIELEYTIPADNEIAASCVAEQSCKCPTNANKCRTGFKVIDKDGRVVWSGGSA